MVETMGAVKEADCLRCGAGFLKKRYDQKFCCRKCCVAHKNQQMAWATRADRTQQNAKRQQRYAANRDEFLRKLREDRKLNPEKYRAADRKNYLRNKKKRYAQLKARRAANPGLREWEALRRRASRPWARCLAHAKQRSSKKSLPFDLTREWAESVWTGECAVTGLPFEMGDAKWHAFSPSIDRVDSSLGYVQTNCRFVLFAVNSLKSTGTDEQMLAVARAIVERSDHQALPPML